MAWRNFGNRGNRKCGEARHVSKLKRDDVRLIRALCNEKVRLEAQRDDARRQLKTLRYIDIGEKFGVTGAAVIHIARGRSWRNG